MPSLSIPNTFSAGTLIQSAQMNANFNAIVTLLNTTGLDNTNIQNQGINRSTKLSLGTANHIVVNDGSGALSSTATLDVGRGGTGQTTYTNGQLLIGNTTGNTLTKATLTAGSGVTITNGGGSITIGVDSTVVWVPNQSQVVTSTGAGSFTVPAGLVARRLAVLVVAGGGGGGGSDNNNINGAGGGGGGGVIYETNYTAEPGQVIRYYLGSGGAGGVDNSSGGVAGSPGEMSYFGSLVAFGGTGGSSNAATGTLRGNGGGGSYNIAAGNFSYGSAQTIGSTWGFFNGGAGAGAPGATSSGGGGAGSKTAGTAAASGQGGNGGDGVEIVDLITGTPSSWGGGGGGGCADNSSGSTRGVGGAGGGGTGSNRSIAATAGTANAGGGGGGGAGTEDGAAGGSGYIKIYWRE